MAVGRITRRSTDLLFTADGDLFLDNRTEDLTVVGSTEDRALLNAVRKRLQSRSIGSDSRGDWKTQPFCGTRLGDYAGAPNDQRTHADIKGEIYRALTYADLVAGNQMHIEVIPFTPRSVLIAVFINSLSGDGNIFLTFDYDLRDNKLVPRNIE